MLVTTDLGFPDAPLLYHFPDWAFHAARWGAPAAQLDHD